MPFLGASYSGGKLMNNGPGMDLPSGGIGCLVAGPKANAGVIAPADLEGFVTINTAEANFGSNGISCGVAVFADGPVLAICDLLTIKAFSLLWGVQFVGGSVSVAGVAMTYQCKLRESSLPFPGAR